MDNETPKEIDAFSESAPNRFDLTSLTDFYDNVNAFRDILYKPYNISEEDKYDKTVEKIKIDFNLAYCLLINNGLFWEFCTLSVYKSNYENRKTEFLKKFTDTDEFDFLQDELKEISALPQEIIEYIDETGYPRPTEDYLLEVLCDKGNYKNINFSEDKKRFYIQDKIDRIKNPQSYYHEQEETKEIINDTTPVKFKGNQTQLVELIKALIESDMLEGTQINAIKQFSKFFDIAINNPDKLIQDIKGKNNDSTTAFLDLLKDNLKKYLGK